MSQGAPPQYSSDGQWWWNGQRWIPVERFVPEPDQEPAVAALSRRPPGGARWLAAAALVGILTLAMIAAFLTASSLAGRRTGSVAPPATPAAQKPSAQPAAPASPATSQVVPAAQYIAAVGPALASAAQRWAGDGQSCTGGNTAKCRAAMADLQSASRGLQQVLDQNPPPACLKPADQTLRSALGQVDQGSGQVIRGLDGQNSVTIAAGASMIASGVSDLRDLTGDLQDANCS